jgi:K+ transporter
VSVSAAIIASQAMISGAYAVIQQSQSLGCFPSVKVVHTSAQYVGQVYIPKVNYVLMISCIIVCAAFRTTDNIGHAYGMHLTTSTSLYYFMFCVNFFIFLFFLCFSRLRSTKNQPSMDVTNT